jgi:MGT family glycosyltransferase
MRPLLGPFTSERLARLAAAGDRELGEVARSFGCPSKTLHELVSMSADLTLIFMPKEFQFEAEQFDDRFLFVGPSLSEVPPSPWPFPKDKTKETFRAYISLGTLRNNDAEFYRTCFSAFDEREWQVVMSVGERVDMRSLGPSPKNFHVAVSVPQTALLPHVDVFVTHGGLNSVMESLYFGIPMVVVPSIKEQRLTARRIGELGLGEVLDREILTAQILHRHARSVACDEEIRNRISTMKSLTRSAGGYKRATEFIVRFTEKLIALSQQV